ncbi:MAG: hypothetical protein ABI045_02840 [Flavobacteriales bacterium]
MRKIDIKTLAYSSCEGFENYYERFVEYYAEQNLYFSEDELIITTGGFKAIYFILGSITYPGDEIHQLRTFLC